MQEDELFLVTAKDIRRMLETQAELTLIAMIDHNLENQAMPPHTNKDIMTSLLQMRVSK